MATSLDQIITVNIDRNTTTPTQAGFGTPMIVGYMPKTNFPYRVYEYSSLTEMETGGFKSDDPIYIAASDMFAQNPSPPTIKFGRRDGAPQQVLNVVPETPTVGAVYSVTVTGYADSTFSSRTVATDTFALIATASHTDAEDVVDAFVTGFSAPEGDWTASKTGTGSSAKLVITADNTAATMDGMLFGVVVTDTLGVNDVTPNPSTSLATDLGAIQLADTDWYGFVIDSNSAAEILIAAAWAESNTKQFVCQTQDILVASTTLAQDVALDPADSVASNLAAYERTMLFYHRDNRDYVCAAMLGRALPEDAGSITWAYKRLNSVSAQNLTTTEQGNLAGKNVNFLTTLAGVTVTRYGTASSGEYMDVIRGTDWLAARIQERVYALLIQNDKLPYTDAGIQAVRSEILAQLQQGVARDFIAADPEPTCVVPRASEVSAADKGSRTLNDVTFRATLAGAVHKVAIEGELNL